MKSDIEERKGKKGRGRALRALGAVLAVALGVGSAAVITSSDKSPIGGATEVYAKDIGSKNEIAKQACEGTAPSWQDTYTSGSNERKPSQDGYTSTGTTDEYYYKHPKDGTTGAEINGVWTGGNAHSANTDRGDWTDSDINDFQSVLPFGTIYVDPTKLYDTKISDPKYPNRTWENWYRGDAAYPFTKDTTITLSEYASDKFMLFAKYSSPKLQMENSDGTFTELKSVSGLYYQRQQESWEERIGYIGDFTSGGKTEVYDKDNDGKALITVTYPNVATLSDGSSADLVIKYTKVTIQTDLADDARKTYTYKDAAGVEHTINVPLGIIDANQLYVDPGFSFGQDKDDKTNWVFEEAKFGVEIEYEVSVEKDGNTVDGTILWTANDLDVDDRYTDIKYNTDGSKVPYAESMEILEGAKSYAVTPYYDHTTPANPLGFQIDNDYYNSADSTANGVRFFTASRLDGSTYDSGFSALISSSGTKMRWTGSKQNHTHMGTVLFDTTVINQIRMSHGTGGGIYLENYDGANGCNVEMIEGIVAHGLYAEATVTAVPEDGYRVKAIYVDDTGEAATGYDATQAGKNKYEITYTYDKDSGTYKVEGIVDPNDGDKVVKIGTDGKYTMSNDIVFEINDDGTVDVTMKGIKNFKHVHADFATDYYFYKVWKGDSTQALDMTAVPSAIVPTDVDLKLSMDADGNVSTDTDAQHFSISGRTYISDDGDEFYLNATNDLCYTGKDAYDNDVEVETGYRLIGNDFMTWGDTGEVDDNDDPIYDWVNLAATVETETSIDVESAKKFVIDNTSLYTNGGHVTVLNKGDADSPSPDNIVWLVRYPEEGVDFDDDGTLDWPELPSEREPDEHKHNYNHMLRNYWFVTEDAPGWSVESYDNTNAKAPGVIKAPTGGDDTYYGEYTTDASGNTVWSGSEWAGYTMAHHDAAEQIINVDNAGTAAYMSIFKNGGEIANVPSIVVQGTKKWEDFSNDFDTRQDIWLHIDWTSTGADGSVTTKKDVLPPQKVSRSAAGDSKTVTWGDRQVYWEDSDNTTPKTVKVVSLNHPKATPVKLYDDDKTLIVESYNDIPTKINNIVVKTRTQNGDGSYKLVDKKNNTWTVWVNELLEKSGVTYVIRETLDKEGNQPVEKKDAASGLIGYTTEADEVKAETQTDDQGNVERYTLKDANGNAYKDSNKNDITVALKSGTIENELELTDFAVVKKWIDGKDHSEDTDVSTLKGAYTLYETGKVVNDEQKTLKLQPAEAVAYTAEVKDETTDEVTEPESGTLETENGTSGGYTTTTFTWHNIPKYVGDTDADGNHITREAVYSIRENQLTGYTGPIYTVNPETKTSGDSTYNIGAKNEGEIDNLQTQIIKAQKVWDDFDNAYETRQDVQLHLDVSYTTSGTSGVTSTRTKKDVLPAQTIAANATTLTATWGDGADYSAAKVGDDTVYASLSALERTVNPGTDPDAEIVTFTFDFDEWMYKGSNGETYYVNELPRYDENGIEIEYAIRETDKTGTEVNKNDETQTLIGYTTEITDWEDFSFTEPDANGVITRTGYVTNTLKRTEFTAKKKWVDDGATEHTAKQIEDSFKLYQNDTASGLDTAKYDVYTEDASGTYYKLKDGTYTETAPDTSTDAGKAEASKYVSTETKYKKGVNLHRTVTGEGSEWTYTVVELPAYAKKGDAVEKAVYSVKEEFDGDATAFEGYLDPVYKNADVDGTDADESQVTDKALNDGTVVNTQWVNVKVTKVWDDDDNRDGKRKEIKVTRIENSEDATAKDGADKDATQTLTTGETGDAAWTDSLTFTWVKLPFADADGNKIIYWAKEDQVADYNESNTDKLAEVKADTADGYDASGYNKTTKTYSFVITNTRDPQKVDIVLNKTWVDEENRDKKRPENITFTIMAQAEGESTAAALTTLPDGAKVTDSEGTELRVTDGKFTVASDKTPVNIKGLDAYKSGQVGKKITYTLVESDIPDYEKEVTGSVIADNTNNTITAKNTHEHDTIKIAVVKDWDDDDNRDGKRDSADLTLWKSYDGLAGELKMSGNDETEGTAVSYADKKVEKTTADGATIVTWTVPVFEAGQVGKAITYRIEEAQISGYEVPTYKVANGAAEAVSGASIDASKVEVGQTATFTVTNKHTPELVTITANKIWDDADDQDGIRKNQTATFTLQRVKADGSGNENVTKDAKDADVTTKTIAGTAGDSSVSWDKLYKYEDGGKAITYVVEESGMSGDKATGYELTKTDVNTDKTEYTFTNTHTPETIDIGVKKVWDDKSNQDGKRLSSVTFRLYAGGEDTGKTVELTADNDADKNTTDEWTIAKAFADLPKYKVSGQEITYTVKEDNPGAVTGAGYTIVESAGNKGGNYTITNTYDPEKTNVTITKVWDDENDKWKKRPTQADWVKTLSLTDDDESYDSSKVVPEVSGAQTDDVWTVTWKDLQKNKTKAATGDATAAITYSVTEDTSKLPEGYTADPSDGKLAADGTVKNTLTLYTITFVDPNPDDPDSPKDVSVKKYPKGETPEDPTDEDDPDEDGTWEPEYPSFEFDGWDEDIDPVTGDKTYTAKYVRNIPVEKVWVDGDNQDGLREAVTIKLNADPDESTQSGDSSATPRNDSITLDDSNSWKGAFTKLPWKTKDNAPDGDIITYTVEEVKTAKMTGTDGAGTYAMAVTGDAVNGFVVTNTHTPETVDIDVTKKWDDANNQDGVRPDEVEFTLVGKVLDAIVSQVSKRFTGTGNEWTATFEKLAKYHEGKEVAYTVIEEMKSALEKIGYKADETKGDEAGNYTITNQRDPEKRTIKVTKIWDDEDDKDKVRPDDVTFTLVKKGTDVADSAKKANASNNWTVEWPDLDRYENGGEEIAYTVKENDVTLYTAGTLQGDMAAGFTITNTYEPVKPEEKTVTRMITYTYLTEDGKEASETVTQTVKLTRTPKTVDPTTGEVTEWNDYEITDGDTSAVENPEIDGWTPNKDVHAWDIDLKDPKDDSVNVIYNPEKPVATPLVTKDGQFDSSDQNGNTVNTQSVNVKDAFKVGTPKLPDGTDNTFTYTIDVPKDEDGNPIPGATVSEDGTTVTVPGEGTYKLDPKTGEITFTPDPNFSGKTSGVTVKGKDGFGNEAETTYTPIVVPNKEVVTMEREVEYTFWDDDGNEVTEKKTETITFTRVGDYNPAKDDDPEGYGSDPDNPDENETIDFPAWTPQTSKAPTNPTEEGWTPDHQPADIVGLTPDTMTENGFVETKVPVVDKDGNPVYETDEDGKVITDDDGNPVQKTETKLVKSETVNYTPSAPEGNPRRTYGRIGRPQEAKNVSTGMFNITTPTTDERDENGNLIPNKIEKVTLIDPDTNQPVEPVLTPVTDEDGNPVYETDEDGNIITDENGNPVQKQAYPSVPAYGTDPETGERVKVGTYTYDPVADKVIFTPEPEFVGSPEPAVLEATDSNGLTARTTYTPRIPDSRQRKTVDREITYVYDNGDGTTSPVLDENGNPLKVTQTATFVREANVDPDTGELVWGDWEPSSDVLPAVKSPTEDDLKGDTGHTARDLKGWEPDMNPVVSAEITIDPDTNEIIEPDDVVVTYIKGPVGKDDETRGPKGQEQTGTPTFTKGTGDIPEKGAYSFPDHDADNPLKKTVPGEGTYELDPDTGEVTFTPEPDFVGKAGGVTVQVTDDKGKTATAKYTPSVYEEDETVTVKRTIHYRYLTKDGRIASEDVVQTVTFKRESDPDTGKLGEWKVIEGDADFAEVTSPEIENYTVDTEKIDSKTVDPNTGDMEEWVIYTPITGPTGSDKETWGLPGDDQKGTPKFNEGTGKITKYELTDHDPGDENTKTVPGEGTYVLDPETGEVTFTPEDGFTGKGTGVEVKATDENGKSATGKYIPNVPEPETSTAKRTIEYLYSDGTPVLDDAGNPLVVIESKEFIRNPKSIDPDTGEVLEWYDWVESKFTEEKSPEIEGYTPNKASVPEEDAKPGDDKHEVVIYNKNDSPTPQPVTEEETKTVTRTIRYWIEKENGEKAFEDVKQEYTFTRTKTTAPDGTVSYSEWSETSHELDEVKSPDKDGYDVDRAVVGKATVDPYSGDIVENVIYTPKETPPTPTIWVTYVDPDGTTIYLEKTTEPKADDPSKQEEPDAPKNPTKDGYDFDGWDRSVDPDGNITYTAKWTPKKSTPTPPEGTEDETWGAPGQKQTSTPEFKFKEGSGKIPEKGAYSLEDPDDDNPLKKTIPGEGVYELDPDTGVVTFTPEDDFRGKGTGVMVKVTDENGLTATGTYTPNVADNVETVTVTRTIEHVYDDGSPVLGEDGKPIVTVQTLTFSRVGTVDPETGEVKYPDWTETKDLPEEKALDWLLETHTAVPNSVSGMRVTGEDANKVLTGKIVYTPRPAHTVTYIDGHTGEQITVDRNIPHHGDSTVPDVPEHEGYKFVGWRTPDGKLVTDLSVTDVTTDLVYTAVYEPVDVPEPRTFTVTYIDSVTGDVIKVDTPVPEHGNSAVPTPPEHEGRTFKGWRKPDGTIVTELTVEDVMSDQEYVAIYDTYYPEAITVARTIHYRYLTQDGEEVVEDHIDSITFTRRAIVDGVTGETTWTEWEPKSHTFAPVDSPEIEGWTPDKAQVGEQTVYPDGTNEELWVIYQPQKGTEEKEITRVVYYTYYTEDGEEASVPVKQTAKLARDWTIDPETGERVYGDWYIVEEPTAADVPEIEGFTPNKTEIPAWEIDLNDPKDGEDVHVVYDKVETPDTYWVTYVDPDGKTIYLEKTTVNKGEDEPEKPEDPKKDGFVFGGWDRSVDEDGNVTYTAIWTPVPTDPTEPTQPTEPTEPTDPTKPTEPTDPTKPTDPTEPTTVTTSVDGKTVVDPTTATQPYVIRDASTGQTIAVVTPAEQSSAVNTGDRNNTAVWIVMAVAAVGAAATAVVMRRRKRD